MLALLVRVDSLDDGLTRSYTFTRSPVRIGRNPLNDLPLAWPFVSQWHAVVQFDDSQAVYYDLGATNGTTCNGQRLGKNVPVAITGPDMDFRIGALRLTFSRAHVSEAVAAKQQRLGSVPGGGLANAERTVTVDAFLGAARGDADHGASTVMLDAAALLAGAAGATLVTAGAPSAPRPAAGATQLGAVRAQLLALGQYVTAYRQAWNNFYTALYGVLQAMPPHLVPAAVAFVLEQFGETAHEPQMQALAQSQGVAVPAAGAGSQLIARLAQAIVPGAPPPATADEMEGFLVRILTVLDAFATAYVGLRQGHEQFETEVVGASRRSAQPTPIDEAQDPRAVLAYLLDWRASDAQARTAALTSTYAEIMTHQVALLGGLMEGVRKLMSERLAPQRLVHRAEESAQGFWKIWPFRGGLYWKQYLTEHDDLSEEKQLTQAVLGKGFARAYTRALGENFSEAAPRRIGPPGGPR
jgi:type VI secretion system protein